MINITGVDLVKFAQKVYEMSSPQGLGRLHFQEGILPDEDAKKIVNLFKKDKRIALNMDYIAGRACKMTVLRKGKNLEIHDTWYDHTDDQLKKLLSHFNISITASSEHGIACNCINCQQKRKLKEKIN
jgi:hypothetical protein